VCKYAVPHIRRAITHPQPLFLEGSLPWCDPHCGMGQGLKVARLGEFRAGSKITFHSFKELEKENNSN